METENGFAFWELGLKDRQKYEVRDGDRVWIVEGGGCGSLGRV